MPFRLSLVFFASLVAVTEVVSAEFYSMGLVSPDWPCDVYFRRLQHEWCYLSAWRWLPHDSLLRRWVFQTGRLVVDALRILLQWEVLSKLLYHIT